jgi:hypothetical protein
VKLDVDLTRQFLQALYNRIPWQAQHSFMKGLIPRQPKGISCPRSWELTNSICSVLEDLGRNLCAGLEEEDLGPTRP